MRNVTVFTNGCPENRNDCARMETYFKRNGWTTHQDIRNSSIIAFNACGLTIGQEENSIRIIESIKALMNPDCRLVVWGCLQKINPERLSTVYQGTSFGSDEPERIDQLVDFDIKSKVLNANYLVSPLPMPDATPVGRFNLRRALDPVGLYRKYAEPAYRRYGKSINLYGPDSFIIKTATGCMSKCAYCAVRISRGQVQSKPIDIVKGEFEDGLAKGYTDFTLIATDVGSYGLDRGDTLADLLDELTRIPGDFQIRIRNMQPQFLLRILPEIKRIVSRKKISYIGATAQSGSDNVLKSMRRGYTVDAYKYAIRELKNACPELKVRTQLMVGFPGETEEDFRGTLKLVDDVDFDYIETFTFQPRLGTAAAKMHCQISEKVAKNRYNRLMLKVLSQYAGNMDLKFPRIQQKMIQLLSALYGKKYLR